MRSPARPFLVALALAWAVSAVPRARPPLGEEGVEPKLPLYYDCDPQPSTYLQGNSLGPILRPKGPVKRVVWYVPAWTPDAGEWERSIVLEYDERGNRTLAEEWSFGSREECTEYAWDAEGGMTSRRRCGRAWEFRYEYDDRGLLVRSGSGDFGAGSYCWSMLHEYDSEGRRVAQYQYDASGAAVRVFRNEYGRDGRIERILLEEGAAGPLAVYEARYDAAGRLVEDRMLPRFRGEVSEDRFLAREIHYERNGIVTRTFDSRGRSTHRSFVVRGEEGELLHRESCRAVGDESLPGELAFRDDGTAPDFVRPGVFSWGAEEYRGLDTLLEQSGVLPDGTAYRIGYDYEFDRFGNWVACHTWTEPEGSPVAGRFAWTDTLRREIEYYDE